jgi:hypothetical protein
MEGFPMEYVCTHKSILNTVMLSFLVISTSSTIQASTPASASASISFFSHISNFAKQHKKLCFASITLPIFGMYARKTIRRFLPIKYKSVVAEQPMTQQELDAAEENNYFEQFADAFGKTLALVGKIYKFLNILTSDDGQLLETVTKL